ncbi:MAG: class I SAM-dependent methyltransferase [bacterium]|nr:class I SAM-dependent methyltransferase [bacterium]
MPTDSKPSARHSGAFHPDLLGGSEALRYRPRRLDTEELSAGLTCQFLVDDACLGPFAVLDLSPTGLAIAPNGDCVLAPGSSVSDLEISYGRDRIWKGTAQAVYQVDGDSPRTGLRFTSGMFDLQLLQLSDSIVETRLALNLEQAAKYGTRLPADWRARVASVRHLLEGAREVVEEAESQLNEDSVVRANEEHALFHRVFDRWGPIFHEQLRTLHSESKVFDGSTRELARAYATRELLSLVSPCPMHRRAYEKPLGYAGDYRMMMLMLQKGYNGESIYSRFLHHVSKNYSFGRMVTTREFTIRRVIRKTISQDRPVRILSLACGPAVELQNLIREIDKIDSVVELVLIDQDEETMQYCHEAVSREILKRGADFASKVTLNCLHLSVRQILQPQGAPEREFIERNISGVDLIYSVGLYDYLPQSIAKKLTRKLYRYLRPGGQLWLGNLAECPDTTWMMEHVLAWHLEYRTGETMLALAKGLNPEPSEQRIATDETELCLFLNAVKPEA